MRKAPYTCLIVVATILGMFLLGIASRVLLPALLNRRDNLVKEETGLEMLAMLKCLHEHADGGSGQFPPSLQDLSSSLLQKHGLPAASVLSEKYWYLPEAANRARDNETPILIEKSPRYRRSEGGYVASPDFDLRWCEQEEYAKLIAQYVKQTGRSPDENASP